MKKPVIGVTTSYQDPAHQENQYVGQRYLDALDRAGAEIRILNFQDPLEKIDAILAGLDGVLIIGGRDVEPCLYGAERLPECGDASMTKDKYEIALIRAAFEAGKPLLGVCRGIQVINVALGGTLVQDLPTSRYGTLHQQTPNRRYWHDVDLIPGTAFAELIGETRIPTNSYHHQAIDRLADSLRVTARCVRDGVIEGVEGTGRGWLMATQWHPEQTQDTDIYSLRFFRELVRQASL